jgi:hypothetical protein
VAALGGDEVRLVAAPAPVLRALRDEGLFERADFGGGPAGASPE